MPYSTELGSPEIEIAGDAATSSFFADTRSRHADLKEMLDSGKDSSKVEAMKRIISDPNQLIRASALRVLSSIRVPIIVPIMMLVIKESVRDMSAYLVIGSAVYAFEEVCPERLDLIHKHYRKLCAALVDVDEWGQEKSSSDCGNELSDESGSDISFTKKPTELDPDLRMLLKNSKSLLQSRNSAVVLAVAQLYYHLAPPSEVNIIARALTYVTTLDKEFAACTIDAIGRCACNIQEVRDSCLVGLVALMSNSNGRRIGRRAECCRDQAAFAKGKDAPL
ncbi:AP-3 complex subunit beta-2 protein [Trichinella spiralis]|uniref:AP-3 complex subunit beta-2 protein n=1 Tax=Trichinella spiralis TaxID=6334 RepID=UPI0001EFD1D7|nr:AP-3 complex subunit beta-2 protein [Trichinella spiralis]